MMLERDEFSLARGSVDDREGRAEAPLAQSVPYSILTTNAAIQEKPIGLAMRSAGIDPLKIARKLWKIRVNEGRLKAGPTPQNAAPDSAIVDQPGSEVACPKSEI